MSTELVVREPKKLGGRVTITVAGCGAIEELAANGHPDIDIARRLGMTMPTFRRCRREQEEVQTALDYGRGRLEADLTNILLSKARGSGRESVIAAIFLAKARCGWREGEAPADARPNITINLPDAQNAQDYLKAVRADYRVEPADPPAELEGAGGSPE
jgi:hypothetical protein